MQDMNLSRMTERLLRLAVSGHLLVPCLFFRALNSRSPPSPPVPPPTLPGPQPPAVADVLLLVLPLIHELRGRAAALRRQAVLQRLVVCVCSLTAAPLQLRS